MCVKLKQYLASLNFAEQVKEGRQFTSERQRVLYFNKREKKIKTIIKRKQSLDLYFDILVDKVGYWIK